MSEELYNQFVIGSGHRILDGVTIRHSCPAGELDNGDFVQLTDEYSLWIKGEEVYKQKDGGLDILLVLDIMKKNLGNSGADWEAAEKELQNFQERIYKEKRERCKYRNSDTQSIYEGMQDYIKRTRGKS